MKSKFRHMGSLCSKPDMVSPVNAGKQSNINGPAKAGKLSNTNGHSKVAIVKALYDFDGMNDGDLIFKKGDKMKIINKSDHDWWEAELMKDKSSGFIPSNFVVDDDSSIEAQEYWFNVDRRAAIGQLKRVANDVGAFMIRKTEDNKLYALSVLTSRNQECRKDIKHYRIKELNGEVGLVKSKTFVDVISLVEYYRNHNLPGESFCLGQPCTRETRNIPFKSLEVDRNSIQLLEKLGDGMFGTVMKAIFNHKQYVAVKMLKENSLMKKDEFVKEAWLLNHLRHPRVVQILGICMEDEPYYMITEYMINGSLLNFLRSNSKLLELDQLIDISAQIADGMSYLEMKQHIHRDLRAANCLVNENNVAKVADFGLAKMVDDGIYEGGETCKFPVKWTAPEGLESKLFSTKSDVWSFGILMFEIFTLGKVPYAGWDNQKIKEEVARRYQLKISPNPRMECPDEIKQMMLTCLSFYPEDRPSFDRIKHFFCNFNDGNGSYQACEER